MKSHYRGRGWAKNTESTVLPRPGRPLSVHDENEEIEHMIQEIQNLVTAEKDNEKNINDKLYKNCLHDRQFGKRLIKVISKDKYRRIWENENLNIRKGIISALQADYTRRNEVMQESMRQFQNMVYLLCELYANITFGTTNRMKVLEQPIIDCLEMLLETSTENGCNIFIELITAHGNDLIASKQNKLDKIMISLRQTLIKEKLSSALRLKLLWVLDRANNNFNPLPENLQKFYDQQQFGNDLTQSQNDDLTINISAKTDNVESINTLMKASVLEDSEKNGQKNYPVSSNNTTLRAIRGSGATDCAKDRKYPGKPHATITPSRKPISSNKGWGHDDRFEKDYE